jgi:hypothetical protein
MAYEDLLKDTSESKDDGNYFLVTITDLDLGTAYPLQFRWKNKNGTLGAWSSIKTFTSASATIPSEPNLAVGDVVGGAGFIKVTWDGNNALSAAASNFDRVNVHISGTTFGDGTKPAGFFKQSGTQTFAAVAGVYIVQLKILTVNGSESLYSTARTVTVTSAVQAASSSVTPSTPTVSSVLGAIQLSWNGKTSTGADQPFGFNAAKVYVGTSAGFTPSSSNQVDVLNFANGQNTLNIGVGTIVDSVALTYGVDYYIKIATTNGTDTSTAVSATGNPVRVGQVTTGDIVTINADKIATGTLSAGSTITVGSTAGKHIKLSGTGDPFIIYGSGGVANPVLSYNGALLTIVGDGTFSGALSAATGTFAGALSAATGSFSGTITASGGSIGGITIAADGIQNSGGTFKLDSSGIIRAGSSTTNAVIISPTLGVYHSSNGGSTASGKFTLGLASSTISGWTIGTSTLSSGNLTLNSNGTITTTNLTIYDTGRILNSGGFEVTAAGQLIATGANITGAITATSGSFTGAVTATSGTFTGTIQSSTGYIGGWFFNSTYLSNIQNDITAYYINASTGAMAMNNIFIRQSAGSNGIDLQNGSDLRVRGGTVYLGTGGSLEISLASIKTGAGDIIDASGNIASQGVLTVTTVGTKGSYSTANDNIALIGVGGTSVVGRLYKVASVSSRKFKENIEDVNNINYLNIVNSLRPVTFNYKPEIVEDPEVKVYGLIAEEVENIAGAADMLVTYKDDEIYSVKYDRLPFVMIKAIQEMSARLDALEG